MQGSPAVIEALNGLLADEFAAIHQYAAHYGALANWGYDGLAALVKDRADDERKHADRLTLRILELSGVPAVGALGNVSFVVNEVPGQLVFDAAAEARAIESYNSAIKLAYEASDSATRTILESIAAEESDHLNEIEGWQDQIRMMGLENFLSARIKA